MANQHATIKAATGFRKMRPEVVFNTSQAIYNALNGSTDIPGPPAPLDLPTLLAANQALSAATSDALDGSRKAIALRNHCKEVVVKILNQLATYVEANCRNDMTIFLSSGFKPQSSTKTAAAPASGSIRFVKPGPMSGQAQIQLIAIPNAGSYEVRWAPVPAGGVPAEWSTRPSTTLRLDLSGLTPGITYAFQTRALIQSGYTEWSDSVTRLAT
jgi:hypothetical protein